MPPKSMEIDFGRRIRGPRGSSGGVAQIFTKDDGAGAPPLSLITTNAASRSLAPKVLPPLTQSSYAPLAVWPSKHKRATVGSKAPLAVQLEAFVRREHRLYLRDHPECAHADTLHIVREAFSVLIEHFLEYRGILSFIRDEYEATFDEVAQEVKRLRTLNLENESDRSLHVMELMRQRESFTTIISNQQAQLRATQGLVHSLREQVAAYEHSNSTLTAQLSQKTEECKEATQRSKMLANAMIEEASRSSHFMEIHKTDEREIGRLGVQVNSLKEKLDDADKRFNVLMKQMMFGTARPFKCEKTEKKDADKIAPITDDETKSEGKEPDVSIAALQRRIDDLLFAYERLKLRTEEAEKKSVSGPGESGVREKTPEERHSDTSNAVASVTSSGLIQSWLLQENLTEAELDAYDYLLPPGNFEEDPLAFLKVCRPVRNLRLKKGEVISMLRSFWLSRQAHRQVSLRHYFLDWLRQQAGTAKAAEEIGVNMLRVCQRNHEDPECRATLLALHFFLPEDVIVAWQRDIRELEEVCRDAPRTLGGMTDSSLVVNALRTTMPDKKYVHMLQLRLYLWRISEGTGRVSVDLLFDKDSHFVCMLKKQLLFEVEEFTLQVVESIRSASEDSKTVRLQDITNIISALDSDIPKGTLHCLVAEATLLTAMDVATASASFTVKLQPVLHRFRSSVLLRRTTPSLGDNIESDLTTCDDGAAEDKPPTVSVDASS
ncbi:hypothetical protein DQ04_00181190 [Trypanosoma grayi]|uniref:hypothetical protein n=1 Tax=Trypanosoma grayi TaxID=71804 RepID=UPI0004F47C98|nr:hypothetical protein DQ04_00181190 [Trypanosoma grayi]KEG15126.1 hypothetical protein DQ04_00181190 [Trypanosoma grayi]